MFATIADVRGLMTIVVVLLIGQAVQAANNQREMNTIVNPVKVSNAKGPRCHHPTTHNCNTSVYPILDWELSGWFYHSMFKSCRPLYSAKGGNVCIENEDLPTTREMCEDLCGESCVMSNGSTGICMFNQMCKIINNKPSAHPRPCGSYNVNCCPKVSDSNLVPYIDSSGNGDLGNRINAADQSSSQTGTLYVYRLPNTPFMEGKVNK
ncbi:uncharacterized protein LOC111028100 [Myzus persicae]|uniref:uncharacterized protein LOC111028100 n=1 Tax=Myzus persicae TaxID=13164 RepID=UPI000B9364D2|nr:uncharacterized protein LOC111028100 [Myzus persicae]